MTNEELEELKSIGQAVAVGERSPDEFYELLAVSAGKLIEAVETVSRLRHLKGLYCDHHKMLDGCGVMKASSQADLLQLQNMNLRKENEKLRELLRRAQSVIDELIRDSDIDDDESKEFLLMQDIAEALK